MKNSLNRAAWLFVLAGMAFFLSACEKPNELPAPPRPVLVMAIAGEGAGTGMGVVGEIRPRFESTQGFRIAGKIIERKVEIGMPVKKGQVLARLDSADANLAVQASLADINAAEAEYALAKATLERQRQLHRQKFISAAALDAYETQFKTATARFEQARAQTSVVSNQARYTTLTADRDGVVSDVRAEPGQVVEAGEVVARISDLRELEVQIPLPESRLNELTIGSEAFMRLWAKREKKYQAKVREMAPAADPVTRSFTVRLSIINPDSDIRMGMTAGVRFKHEANGEYLIPGTALTQWEGEPTVWLVDTKTNQTTPRPVKIKSYREDGAVISEGLAIGDLVVIAGIQALLPGQTVRPVESPKTSK